MRFLFPAVIALLPTATLAADFRATITDAVNEHVLTRIDALAETTATLASTAQQDCAPTSAPLRAAYGTAFDAWIAASHLRFGPSEAENRAYALSFWPDTRSATPKTLAGLIASEDAAVDDPAEFAEVSIAGRGFYALEFALYDPAISAADPVYLCKLITALTRDIADTSAAIQADWHGGYAALLLQPGVDGNDTYRSESEALQELYKALNTGLQVTADTRLGMPLGTFDRPRPKRAEARRSARSKRHVEVSLVTLRDLALRLASGDETATTELTAAFDRAFDQLETIDDPTFAGVADPMQRFQIEALQQSIHQITNAVAAQLSPLLGVGEGFNALDGD
ncbi:imelysin family protein [Actibacterium lipolyticum]|uniref:Imelysin n=1 Tax=Actibacterium lipolyticum TaxID=1524263 RepID=A0A238KQ25_9RHOB|nr:imelysin family protein [Actibacterium lipolyticum]SMX44212.1 Imelysin [Actibacterium lipolyticum]